MAGRWGGVERELRWPVSMGGVRGRPQVERRRVACGLSGGAEHELDRAAARDAMAGRWERAERELCQLAVRGGALGRPRRERRRATAWQVDCTGDGGDREVGPTFESQTLGMGSVLQCEMA